VVDKLVTIAKFSDSFEANLAKQVLADFGIEAVVTGENVANLYIVPLHPVELQVRESQSQRAQEILESGDTQEDAQED
jgi:hypothetical protein